MDYNIKNRKISGTVNKTIFFREGEEKEKQNLKKYVKKMQKSQKR